MSAPTLGRRGFLQTGASAVGGLLVRFALPISSRLAAEPAGDQKLNAFVHIAADDTVTLFIHKAEMGQGTVTSLSMLLAEELECDWKKIRTEFPGVDPAAYGPMQGVFGSLSIRTSWEPLRKAGAQARAMLVEAAARKWGISESECRAENSYVIRGATGDKLSYGSLADAAAKLTPPANIKLKDASQFHLIGTSPKRLDTPSKVDGSAKFGIDVRVPDMVYAVLKRCPVFGGKVKSFDASKTKAVPGVKGVVPISNGVAVLADNTWTAMEGRRALKVEWDEGPMASSSTATIGAMMRDLASKPGATARKEGDAAAALASAAKKIEAEYQAPYLAHAPMEPLNCVAHVQADGCDVWASTQIQTLAAQTAARITGLPSSKVRIHTMYLGGGFGRRGGADYIGEAVEISKKAGVPVKLTWSREDDLQHDMYRPAAHTRLVAGLDAEGWPIAWNGRIACPSFAGLRNGIDHAAVEGMADLVYEVPNILVEYNVAQAGIPVSYWRSVGYSQNIFFTESFIDELAAAGGKDPLALRRRLLANSPRPLGVLELAAEKSGYGKPLPTGHYQGIGLANNVGSFNAQIAEVSVTNGKLKVHRVVCAVDCGQVVNPAGLAQQIRSGIIFGLTAALKDPITIERGRVVQRNFNDYEVLRIDEAPVVEVYTAPSTHSPGGIGEAAVPAIAPAVANAVFAATGKRMRSLPIRPADLA